MADRHIRGAVFETHSFVPVFHSISQRHTELMTLAVQRFWLESQLVAKMELLEDFSQSLPLGEPIVTTKMVFGLLFRERRQQFFQPLTNRVRHDSKDGVAYFNARAIDSSWPFGSRMWK
jgi:hypothetical protein